MALIKYEPFLGWMDRFFDQDFMPNFSDSRTCQIPVDIYEKNNNLVMDFEFPGLKKDDIEIELDGRTLTVKGKTENNKEIENHKYYRRERTFGEFTRSFTLPENIKEKDIKANFDNGILKISFPKLKKVESKKQIEIH